MEFLSVQGIVSGNFLSVLGLCGEKSFPKPETLNLNPKP